MVRWLRNFVATSCSSMVLFTDENGLALHLEDAPNHPGKRQLSWQDETGAIADMIVSDAELEVLRIHLNTMHAQKTPGT